MQYRNPAVRYDMILCWQLRVDAGHDIGLHYLSTVRLKLLSDVVSGTNHHGGHSSLQCYGVLGSPTNVIQQFYVVAWCRHWYFTSVLTKLRVRAIKRIPSTAIKGKGKGLDTCYSAAYMSQTRDQQRFTISEVAADWYQPIVPQRIMWPCIARANGQLDPRCS